MSTDGNKAVFLDRDGTINIEKNYLYKVSDFEYMQGVISGLKALSEMGYLLVVITNQSGIARGFYTEEDYHKLDDWMRDDLKKREICITESYYCPHFSDGIVDKYAKDCNCRKPKTGLFWKAAYELGINMNKSYAIGDKIRDLTICNEAGVKGILLSNSDAEISGYDVCSDWASVVEKIKRYERSELT